MRQLEILVDLDGICADFMGTLVDMYNTYEAEDDQGVELESCKGRLPDWTPMGKDLWKYVNAPGFYSQLPPLPGAVDALERLKDAGHEVVILTSPGANPQAAAEKLIWCRKHMPFLNHHDVIVTPRKHQCCGDVFIDDDQQKIAKMRKRWPHTKMLGIEWPYNREEAKAWDFLAPSYEDTARAWTEMLKVIEGFTTGT
jgi:5'-nucleotidase